MDCDCVCVCARAYAYSNTKTESRQEGAVCMHQTILRLSTYHNRNMLVNRIFFKKRETDECVRALVL